MNPFITSAVHNVFRPSTTWQRLWVTWVTYVVGGLLSLPSSSGMSGTPSLYLASGFALAFVIGWGPKMLWGVAAGGLSLAYLATSLRPHDLALWSQLVMCLTLAVCASVQAIVGRKMIMGHDGLPPSLEKPRKIIRFLVLSGPVAAALGALIGTGGALLIEGITLSQTPGFFLHWWAANVLGILLGAPMMLPWVSQPAALWRPRRSIVTLPLLITSLLLSVAIHHFSTWSRDLQRTMFHQASTAVSQTARLRVTDYLHALNALHRPMSRPHALTRQEFENIADYWQQSLGQGHTIGWVVDAPPTSSEKLKVIWRRQNASNSTLTNDADTLEQAFLSSPASRQAYEWARDSGEIQASASFPVDSSEGQVKGMVFYRALYTGQPVNESERRRAFKGAVFITVRVDDAVQTVLRELPSHLAACLYESRDQRLNLLSGSQTCNQFDPSSKNELTQSVMLNVGGQAWDLIIWNQSPIPLTGNQVSFWLLTISATLLATALGTLLLVVTAHARQLETAMEDAKRLHAQADQANRAKSEFLSRMSHELRTPLNAVLGFAQVMELDSQSPLPVTQAKRVQQIQQAGWHLLDMIDDVLDISRVDSGTMRLNCQPQGVHDALLAAANLVNDKARRRGITMNWPTNIPSAWGVEADATRLRQILTNLLSNAIKYNRPNGTVVVTVQRNDHTESPTLRIAVTDTGLGLSPEQQSQLFQPFNRLGRERGATEGSGIGLVISRHLAVLMRGDIEVVSKENEGSTFTLVLPAVDMDKSGETGSSATQPSSSGNTHHLLYVDATESPSNGLKQSLVEHPQIKFSAVKSAEEALVLLHNHQLGPKPDIVVVHTPLPDASALDLIKLIKTNPNTAGIKVITIASETSPKETDDLMAAGVHRHYTAPLDVATMLKDVNALLEC